MKSLVVLFSCTILGIFLGVWLFQISKSNPTLQTLNQNLPNLFSASQPPRQTQSGKIASYSGLINWQSRTATAPSPLTELIPIQQGEIVQTTAGSQLSIQFPSFNAQLDPLSQLEFAQTLPVNLVLNQTTGTIHYQNLGPNPLSIRVKHLLINPTTGSYTLAIDSTLPTLVFSVSSGSATIAYNDSDNLTRVITVPSNKQLNFNDETRIAKINPKTSAP